ncbi:antibiotic biosynthesis monooxygenase [Nocardioidaceae bacterium]|nr:antibiotic biosynthesis monooxygenase [Nocardioidaceae bacterium]
MSTPTQDNRELLTVVAYMNAAPGKADELREGLKGLIDTTLAEEGCINYDLHESIEKPGWFTFYENWESEAHLDAHLAAPHLVEFASRIPELLDEDGLSVNRVRRIA